METENTPAPTVKTYTRHLSVELKETPVNSEVALVLTKPEAIALVNYGRRKGWKTVSSKRPDGKMNVWRTA